MVQNTCEQVCSVHVYSNQRFTDMPPIHKDRRSMRQWHGEVRKLATVLAQQICAYAGWSSFLRLVSPKWHVLIHIMHTVSTRSTLWTRETLHFQTDENCEKSKLVLIATQTHCTWHVFLFLRLATRGVPWTNLPRDFAFVHPCTKGCGHWRALISSSGINRSMRSNHWLIFDVCFHLWVLGTCEFWVTQPTELLFVWIEPNHYHPAGTHRWLDFNCLQLYNNSKLTIVVMQPRSPDLPLWGFFP